MKIPNPTPVTKPIVKLLTNSKGKANSIRDIVAHEYAALGKNLRLLVLTDYIRKEYESAVGDAHLRYSFNKDIKRASDYSNALLGRYSYCRCSLQYKKLILIILTFPMLILFVTASLSFTATKQIYYNAWEMTSASLFFLNPQFPLMV